MKIFLLMTVAAAMLAGPATAQPAAPPPSPSAAAPTPIDPERMALARQVVELSGEALAFDQTMERSWPAIEERLAENPRFRPEWRAPFMQAAREEMASMRPQFLTAGAELYARRFTAVQLRDYLVFLRSPTGRAIAAQQGEVTADAARIGDELGARMVPGLLERFGRLLRQRGDPDAPPTTERAT